jgi:hypothetical protein
MAAVITLLLLPLPVKGLVERWPVLMQALENSVHAPMFAVLASMLWRALRVRPGWSGTVTGLVSLLAGVALGGLTEYVQAVVGRDSSWDDLGNDILGTLGGVAWRTARSTDGMGRRLGIAIAALAMSVAFWPLGRTIAAYGYRAAAAPVLWRADSSLLRRFSYVQQGRYPGLVLFEVPANWCAYAELQVELRNASATRLRITLRAHDAAHDRTYADRFNHELWLEPAERRLLRVPLDEVRAAPAGRSMDLSRMRGLAVFQEIADIGPLFRIMEIRLMPSPAPNGCSTPPVAP